MTLRTLLLIDGEHYPPVIEAALPGLRASGRMPVVALFLGGYEKTDRPPDLGIPVTHGDPAVVLRGLIEEYDVDLVLDLSDEPVVDPRSRLMIGGLAMAAGATYQGGGFEMAPPSRPVLTDLPTVSVIGTGKRTGKTGVSIELARHWRGMGRSPCIVTMGRGGPPHPLVMRGDGLEDPEEVLDGLLEQGLHATSDYVEDALFARVDTVGTRRLGAGPGGVTVHDEFAAGVEAALALEPGMLIYEGSGTAIPPAYSDATVLVTASSIDPEFLTGYLGSFRLALADVVIVVGSAGEMTRDVIAQTAPQVVVLGADLEPEPTTPVDGRAVVLVTTAPEAATDTLSTSLLSQGAASVRTVHSLGDRRRLATDLGSVAGDDLVLTEVKAAAATVVLGLARSAGAEIGFVHNRVAIEGGTKALAELLERRWSEPSLQAV